MLINFVTYDGKNLAYDIPGILTNSDINNIADWYCQNHPNKLPTHVWLHPSLYGGYASIMVRPTIVMEDGKPTLGVLTGAGILIIRTVPYGFSKFVLLLGTQDDYDNYFIDEVFEDVVLKDCETE